METSLKWYQKRKFWLVTILLEYILSFLLFLPLVLSPNINVSFFEMLLAISGFTINFIIFGMFLGFPQLLAQILSVLIFVFFIYKLRYKEFNFIYALFFFIYLLVNAGLIMLMLGTVT